MLSAKIKWTNKICSCTASNVDNKKMYQISNNFHAKLKVVGNMYRKFACVQFGGMDSAL